MSDLTRRQQRRFLVPALEIIEEESDEVQEVIESLFDDLFAGNGRPREIFNLIDLNEEEANRLTNINVYHLDTVLTSPARSPRRAFSTAQLNRRAVNRQIPAFVQALGPRRVTEPFEAFRQTDSVETAVSILVMDQLTFRRGLISDADRLERALQGVVSTAELIFDGDVRADFFGGEVFGTQDYESLVAERAVAYLSFLRSQFGIRF